jgi:geranylgeranyl pyrophosphate synthase
MFIMAMHSAAAECHAPEITAQRLARAGYYLGMVFQMTDDLLDYEGDAAITKKNVQKDLAQGIVTYPLIHAIAVSPEVKKILKKKKLAIKDVEYVTGIVNTSGGLAATARQARIFYDRAEAWINKALDGKNTDGLMELLTLAYCRES